MATDIKKEKRKKVYGLRFVVWLSCYKGWLFVFCVLFVSVGLWVALCCLVVLLKGLAVCVLCSFCECRCVSGGSLLACYAFCVFLKLVSVSVCAPCCTRLGVLVICVCLCVCVAPCALG